MFILEVTESIGKVHRTPSYSFHVVASYPPNFTSDPTNQFIYFLKFPLPSLIIENGVNMHVYGDYQPSKSWLSQR